MDLQRLINNPEQMDRETLYELRSLLALYPYFQTVRILLLQNLYLLHDPTFDEELRCAAVYLGDRRKLFELVEAAHYQLRTIPSNNSNGALSTKKPVEQPSIKSNTQNITLNNEGGSRTITLIDKFLDALPPDSRQETQEKHTHRKPTPADAAVDYVSYLLESEDENDVTEDSSAIKTPKDESEESPTETAIDRFVNQDGGKFNLKDDLEFHPESTTQDTHDSIDENSTSERGYFTETLASIYIRQHRYDRALEIIKQLNLNNPKKNAYFADQIRYLEKLIANEQ